MIQVLDSVKKLYKTDSVEKNYFIVFRDKVGGEDNGNFVMLTNGEISSESLEITESICSSGNFQVGLCESASAKVKAVLTDNVKNNEIFVFQVLDGFHPEITVDDTKGIQITEENAIELTSSFTSTNIIYGLDSNKFDKEKDYLVFAKLKYIGDPIYLYVETPGGNARMVYYLKEGLFNFANIPAWTQGTSYKTDEMVRYNGYIYQSRTVSNTTQPSDNTNKWKNITHYIQIVIPIIGMEFYEYKIGIYANTESEYGTLSGQATIYEVTKPVMPLGLFTIKSCRRTNDGIMRDIEAYDRMQDVGLDVDVYLSGSTNTQIGLVLDQAAAGTQIVVGSNLSKQAINPILVSEQTVSFPQFPTGTIYQCTKNETQQVQGTYSETKGDYCSLDYTRTDEITLSGNHKDGGAYSHTQMQIIDGALDESATSQNKEFSTTLRKTIKGTVIDSDNQNWDTYSSQGKIRTKGTRRQTRTHEENEQLRYERYRVDYQWLLSYTEIWGTEEYPTSNWFPYGQYPSGTYTDLTIDEYYWKWGGAQQKTWSQYSTGNRYTIDGINYYCYNQIYGELQWDDDEVYSYDPCPSDTETAWRSCTSQFRYDYDTSYGYYYANLEDGWSVDDSGGRNNDYTAGQVPDSGWVDINGNAIKSYLYLDMRKTLNWKYNWDALASKTAADTNWAAYGTGSTFQYQSFPRDSRSEAKYSLASTRPAKASWYTALNTYYSDVAVYKKMSRRYTRTHNYDYTFTNPGNGFAKYKNSSADNYYNYVKDTSANNKLYTGVTLADQKNVGTYSNVTVYNTVARDYRRSIGYGYVFKPPSGKGWTHNSEDYLTSSDRKKYIAGNVYNMDGMQVKVLNDVYVTYWRPYERTTIYRWTETAVMKKMKYAIPYNLYDSSYAYTVYLTFPTDSKAYVEEDKVRELCLSQIENRKSDDGLYEVTGVLNTDEQSNVRSAIKDNSSQTSEVTVGTYKDSSNVTRTSGVFEIYWVYSLSYSGTIQYGTSAQEANALLSGTIYAANPYIGLVQHSQAEKFNEMPVTWGRETIHGTRRSIVAGFLELHGMFINFDRWGVSTIRNIKASTLYPAENLYPHDSTVPGLEDYGDIYPSIGSMEVTDSSLCKSIYIDDDLNNEFDGILITKSQVTVEEASYYPFYYNRMTKRYGALPIGMPETSTTPWEGNNYYKIEGNFFFENFVFSATQLKSICEYIISNIGSLQYFNLTAELKALPYMEVGDNIDIMTRSNGYETAILRRIMKGCIAQMDSIETDFY